MLLHGISRYGTGWAPSSSKLLHDRTIRTPVPNLWWEHLTFEYQVISCVDCTYGDSSMQENFKPNAKLEVVPPRI